MSTPSEKLIGGSAYKATPETFQNWADEGQAMLERHAQAENQPNEARVLRAFRKAEAMELVGLSEYRWLQARKKLGLEGVGDNRITLEQIHSIQEEAGIRPRRPEKSKCMRLAVANFKGGASKTTTALHLAQSFAFRGYRTLLVDADPQGTASRLMGFRPEAIDEQYTLLPIFRWAAQPTEELVDLQPLKSHIDGLDILPAVLTMVGCDIDVAAAFMRRLPSAQDFYRLVDAALDPLDEHYDIIIIDTAPAFSFLALNILWAANALLIPLPPSYPDFSSTIDFCGSNGDLMRQIEVLKGYGKDWDPTVFVHTMDKPKAASAQEVRDWSAGLWGHHRLDVFIPHSPGFPAAQTAVRSIYETNSSNVDSATLRRCRMAFDALTDRLTGIFNTVWESQVNAAVASEVAA